jgi:hypothetical protein
MMCGVLSYLAYSAWERSHNGFSWMLGTFAVIYNPILPLHLGREIWVIINLLTGGLLIKVYLNAAKAVTLNNSDFETPPNDDSRA